MHKFQSKTAVYRMRLAALLFILKLLIIPTAIASLVYSIWIYDRKLILISIGLVNAVAIIMVLQWFIARRANCPLCMAPVLVNKHCVKHRDSKPLLGSYYLRVALSVIFKNQFRCPYCSETSALRVRIRRGRG